MQLKFAHTMFAGALVATGLALATPATANAQIVLKAEYGSDADFGVGGGFGFPLTNFSNGTAIKAEATFDYFFPSCDGCDAVGASFKVWEINGNAMAHMVASQPSLYFGAGVRYYKWDYSFDGCGIYCDAWANADGIGLNLLAGWDFSGTKKTTPFVEAKFEVGNGNQFVVSGGIRF